MRKLKLTMGNVVLEVQLLDTLTASVIYDAAPFTSRAQTWGDEVYFHTPVQCAAEPDASDVLEPGEVAFWLAGSCIAIPFGPTPVSIGKELRLASPANIWGRVVGDLKTCSSVSPADNVLVERI